MYGLNSFSLNRVDSKSFWIIMTEPPKIQIAERAVETVNIPGRSGDLILDMGRYKNVKITYKCALIVENANLRDAAVGALELLAPSAMYKRLENTYQPNVYRMARISSGITVDSIVEQAGYFSVEFDCKPQRFLKSGEHATRLSASSKLYNRQGFPALPRITVYGTGAGELTVGGVTVRIKAMEGHLILDSETQNAFRVADSGAIENQNANIYAPEFPVLADEITTISWSGDITNVEIIPRWWTL